MNRNLKALKLFVGAAAGLALVSPAMAVDKFKDSVHTPRGGSYTFPAFNLFVPNPGVTEVLDVSGVPAGTYGSYEISVDWTNDFDAWSSEARAGLWSVNDGAYAAPFVAPNNGASNDAPVTLNWAGSLEFEYNGGDPLEFDANQTWGGSSANWDNIAITLFEGSVTLPMLSDIAIAKIGPGANVTGNNSGSPDVLNGTGGFGSGSWSGGDDVYELNWTGGDLVVDLLFTHADGDLDLFVWGNDTATNLLGSGLSVSDNEQVVVPGLAAGTYWIHIDGWLGASNDYKLNVIPTPGALAVFGLAGLAGLRRRR
ncbi:MAG: hypothetical protein EA376_07695 [Phycisphaeraceae bacterium]|nr:MAG: hypothetical protein EA376_07695 [Phycisphaeraceae bacterium]